MSRVDVVACPLLIILIPNIRAYEMAYMSVPRFKCLLTSKLVIVQPWTTIMRALTQNALIPPDSKEREALGCLSTAPCKRWGHRIVLQGIGAPAALRLVGYALDTGEECLQRPSSVAHFEIGSTDRGFQRLHGQLGRSLTGPSHLNATVRRRQGTRGILSGGCYPLAPRSKLSTSAFGRRRSETR
jgi:hypothetical protein